MIIKTRKKKNNYTLPIIIGLIGLVMIANIILIARIIVMNRADENLVGSNTSITKEENKDNSAEESPELSLDEQLRNMSESKRMKKYVGVFFENIEKGKYEDAFKVLNEDFKLVYFHNSLDEFTQYAKKYFDPSVIVVSYDNIERLENSKTGNMYVLWLTIGNLFQPKLAEDSEIPQTNFVIIEYDYNNYEMSFSLMNYEE